MHNVVSYSIPTASAGGVGSTAAAVGVTPTAVAPAARSPLSAARRVMPTSHLRRLRWLVARGGRQLLRGDVPSAREAAEDDARHAGRDWTDAALCCVNGWIGIGRCRPLDVHGRVQRHPE